MFNNPCKCCLEKDNRIADLKDQIQYLRGLTTSNQTIKAGNTPTQAEIERDAIISESPDAHLEPYDAQERRLIEEEAQRMLSGTY